MTSYLTNDTLFSTYIQIKDSGSSNKIILQSPSIISDYTYTLPPNYGSNNQVLSTNGSGTLAWTDNGVISVSGTTNRITVTGTTNAVIDIAATYVGQTSITTLGTITSGTWNGAIIGPTYGGTGINNGSSTITIAGNLSTASALSIDTAATVNQLFYTSATNTLSGLTNQINSGLLTDGSGNISWVTVTGTGAPVLANSPVLITPNIGVANGTSLSLTSTTAATSSSTGSIITAGGIGIGKNIWIGAAFTAANTTSDGSVINIPSFTYTSSSVSPSNVNISSISSVTINSSSTSTVTTAASHYINGPPIAGTNTTITNPLALRVNSGNMATGGNVLCAGTYNNVSLVNAIGNSSNILFNNVSTVPTSFVQQQSSTLGTSMTNKGTASDMYIDGTLAYTSTVGIYIMTKTLDSSGQVIYTDQGSPLLGTGASGNNYRAVSLYNNTVAFSDHDDSGGGVGVGGVWVFNRTNTTWTEQTSSKLVGTGAVGGSAQGYSVSLDVNTLASGGLTDNLNAGATWIFTRSGSTWTQQGSKLVGTGAVDPARQGSSVSLFQDTVAIGAVTDNTNIGATWIFVRSGTTWSQQGSKLVGSPIGGSLGSRQGTAVCLYKDTVAIGGPLDSDNTGAVWIFTRSGTSWTQQQKLVGTGAVGNAFQGTNVSINEDTVVFSGPNDNANIGAIWVFKRTGTTWTQIGSKIVISGVTSPGIINSVRLGCEGNFIASIGQGSGTIGNVFTFADNNPNSVSSNGNLQWNSNNSQLSVLGNISTSTLTVSGGITANQASAYVAGGGGQGVPNFVNTILNIFTGTVTTRGSGISFSGGYFTVTSAGYYLVSASLRTGVSAGAGYIGFSVNGGNQFYGAADSYATANDTGKSPCGIIPCNANDTISIMVYMSANTVFSVSNQIFAIVKLF